MNSKYSPFHTEPKIQPMARNTSSPFSHIASVCFRIISFVMKLAYSENDYYNLQYFVIVVDNFFFCQEQTKFIHIFHFGLNKTSSYVE